jgi:hypothetical protein
VEQSNPLLESSCRLLSATGVDVGVDKGVTVAVGVGVVVGGNVGTNVGEAVAVTVGVSADGKGVTGGLCPVQPAIINNKRSKRIPCTLVIVRRVPFSLLDNYSTSFSGESPCVRLQ